jgi:hypothetical protein
MAAVEHGMAMECKVTHLVKITCSLVQQQEELWDGEVTMATVNVEWEIHLAARLCTTVGLGGVSSYEKCIFTSNRSLLCHVRYNLHFS